MFERPVIRWKPPRVNAPRPDSGGAPRGAGRGAATYPEWFRQTLPRGYGVPRHIAYILDLVQRVVEGEILRLCISTPPQHGKSETVTRRLPLYWSGLYPGDVIVQTGYN